MATSPTPGTRRRLLFVEATINKSGEFVTLDVNLPETAQRVTGIYAATMPINNQLYNREDAFVIFAPLDDQNPGAVASAVVEESPRVTVLDVLFTGYKMASSYASYDPLKHVGFYQTITDEFPLVRLQVPKQGGPFSASKSVYYAHTVTMGRPKIVDGNGVALPLTTEINSVRLRSFLTQFVTLPTATEGITSTVEETSSEVFLCRVDFPAPSGDTFFNQSGYREGILFPGDATRF